MKKKIHWVTCARTGGLFTLLGGRASLQDTKWNICYQYYYAFQWHATSDKSDTQHVCTCMFKNHHEQMKKRIKIYHLQPVGVTYWPWWGNLFILMIILEVTSYWGMQWGKKSISLRNIRHQRYLVLDKVQYMVFQPLDLHTTEQRGGRGLMEPPLGFCFVAIFDLWYFIFSTTWGIFYGWWSCWRSVTSPNMVAILATILDFIKN